MDPWMSSGEERCCAFSSAVEEEEDVSSSFASPDIVDVVGVCDTSAFVESAGTFTGIGLTTCISIVPKETWLLLLLLRRLHVGAPCFTCFWVSVWRCAVVVDSSADAESEKEDAKLVAVADDASALLALAPAADIDSSKISRQLLGSVPGIVGEHARLSPKPSAVPSLEADVGRNVVVTYGSRMRKTSLAGVIYRCFCTRGLPAAHERINAKTRERKRPMGLGFRLSQNAVGSKCIHCRIAVKKIVRKNGGTWPHACFFERQCGTLRLVAGLTPSIIIINVGETSDTMSATGTST